MSKDALCPLLHNLCGILFFFPAVPAAAAVAAVLVAFMAVAFISVFFEVSVICFFSCFFFFFGGGVLRLLLLLFLDLTTAGVVVSFCWYLMLFLQLQSTSRVFIVFVRCVLGTVSYSYFSLLYSL